MSIVATTSFALVWSHSIPHVVVEPPYVTVWSDLLNAALGANESLLSIPLLRNIKGVAAKLLPWPSTVISSPLIVAPFGASRSPNVRTISAVSESKCGLLRTSFDVAQAEITPRSFPWSFACVATYSVVGILFYF